VGTFTLAMELVAGLMRGRYNGAYKVTKGG